MNAEEIKLVINPIMETGDIKTAVNQIQGFFNKMNLSKGMKGDMESIFRELIDEAETFEKKSKEAFKTAGDVKSFENSGKKIVSLFEKISQTMTKLGGEDLSKLFTIDDSRITSLTSEITKLEQKISQLSAAEIKNVTTAIQQMNNVSKSGSISKFFDAFKAGDMSTAESALKGLIQNVQAFGGSTADTKVAIDLMMQAFDDGKIDDVKASFDMLESSLTGAKGNIKDYVSQLGILINSFATLSGNGDIAQAKQDIQAFSQEIQQINNDNIRTLATNFNAAAPAIKNCEEGARRLGTEMVDTASNAQRLSREVDELKNRATYFLSLENSVDLFRQGVRKAIDTVKELDAAMAETAVVTDFSIGDMWDKLPEYTQMANELGVATQGVYEASTLYYQQGLKTEEVMALTNETLKMARIAGLECADATDLMTAALRGFNMEINETSAQRVNDVYSELAAITAADTNEIATAMTKTASIANSANMELETTAALLAQMIETTREPAETAGTAMKTIIARFTEMKKAVGDVVTVEGEEVNVNKVEEALRSAGVALRDVNGEFRATDDVFLELASKWNSLDIMTQRYIATTAAGSRQQSRFIAMMQDYDRTVELVDAAYNSAGSSSQQFAKTQESLQSKLARLENAWNTFLMGIADDKIIKGIVDILTGLLNAYNKVTSKMDGMFGSLVRIGTVFAGLRGALALIEKMAVKFTVLKGTIDGTSGSLQKMSLLGSLKQRIDNFKKTGSFSRGDAKAATSQNVGQQLTTAASSAAETIKSGAAQAAEILIKGAETAAKVEEAGAVAEAETEEAGAVVEGNIEKKDGLAEGEIEKKGAIIESANEETSAIVESEIENSGAIAETVVENDGAIVEATVENAGAVTESEIEIAGAVAEEAIENSSSFKSNYLNQSGVKPNTGGSSGSWSNGFKQLGSKVGGAVKGLVSALGTLAPLIAVLVAEVGIISAAWYFSDEQSQKRKIKTQKETSKGLSKGLDSARTALNGVINSKSGLQGLKDELNALTVGTDEWRLKLLEVQAEEAKIIDQFNLSNSIEEFNPETGKWETKEVKHISEDGTITEEGWKYLEEKQEKAVRDNLSASQIASARLAREEWELEKIQELEEKEDEVAQGDDTTGGIVGTVAALGLGTTGALAGAGIAMGSGLALSSAIATGLAGMASGAVAGSAVPIAGTIIGAVAGLIAGAAIGYGVNEAIEEGGGHGDEYKKTEAQLEKEQRIAEQKKYIQYKSALSSTLSENEKYTEQEIEALSSINASNMDALIKIEEEAMGMGDWNPFTLDGANKEEKRLWAEYKGYTWKGDKAYDSEGNEVDMSDNEAITRELAIFKAMDQAEKNAEAIRDNLEQASNAIEAKSLGEKEDLSNLLSGSLETSREFIDYVSSEKGQNQIAEEMLKGKSGQEKDELISAYTGLDLKTIQKLSEEQKKGFLAKFLDLKAQQAKINQLYATQDFIEASVRSGAFSNAYKKNGDGYQAQKDSQDYKDLEALTKQLTYEQQETVTQLISSMTDNLNYSAGQVFVENLKGLNTDEIENYINTFKNIDLTNPIQAFRALSDAADDGNDSVTTAIEKTASTLLEAEKEDFSVGNQFEYLVTSGTFDSLKEDIDEIIESNGKLTSRNINQLAESSADLATFLEQDEKLVRGVAKAFTLLAKGEDVMDGITTATLKATSAVTTLQDSFDEVAEFVENFDPGTDSMAGVDFYDEAIESMQEMLNNFEYGNPQLENYLESFFNIDFDIKQDDYKKQIDTYFNKMKKYLQKDGIKFWQEVASSQTAAQKQAMAAVGDGFRIYYENGILKSDIGTATTQSIIDWLMKPLEEGGYALTEAAAQTLLNTLVTHSPGTAQDLAANNYEEYINNLIKEGKGRFAGNDSLSIISENEIEYMASINGVSPEQFATDLQNSVPEGTTLKIIPKFEDEEGNAFSPSEIIDTLFPDGVTQANLAEFFGITDFSGAVTIDGDAAIQFLEDMGASGSDAEQVVYNLAQQMQNLSSVPVEISYEEKKIQVSAEIANFKEALQIASETITEDDWSSIVSSLATAINKISPEDLATLVTTVDNALDNLTATIIQFKFEEAIQKVVDWFEDHPFVADIISGGAYSASSSEGSYAAPATPFQGQTWNNANDGYRYMWDGSKWVKQDRFAKGTGSRGAPRSDLYLTGEEGPELVQTEDGAYLVGTHGPEMTYLNKGDVVYSNPDTKKIFHNQQIPSQKPWMRYNEGNVIYDPDAVNTEVGEEGEEVSVEVEVQVTYEEKNADKQLEAINRQREVLDKEEELISKLPQELQGPLMLMNTAEDMVMEYKEIQINKNKLAALETQETAMRQDAKYLGEYYYYDDFLDSYMYNTEKMADLDKDERQKVEEELAGLEEVRSKINEVSSELEGGKIQKAFLTAGKTVDAFSKALKDTEGKTDDLGDTFAEFGKGTILEKPLRELGNKFENLIDESEFLDKEFKGFGKALDKIPISDGLRQLVSNTLGEDAAGQLGNKGLGTALSGLFGEGGAMAGMPGAEAISGLMGESTIGAALGSALGPVGSALGSIGSMLTFDMMGSGMDMFGQMKDMASQMIQYVVQFVQTVINWWINREDWLYNLLSAIEQEVHNFNRQEQVEERFRLYSDEGLDDLVSAWEAMRESLEKQIDLNEQLIKSRQSELQFLNLTNLPFSPAFYYDYTEERVIENPWVYDIYVLLLDLGAMIPEIGGIFSSIKQLMEDNKKRMEDAVKEIEDAREEILELEKKQLELRTKYMEDEIELEELVMDTIIEKQQEEIDELSAMNDAITEGNEKLIETLNNNLDRIREMRDNEDKEEELGEKERRLAFLRQDTSNANRKEIYDLQEELKDERRDYTDELIDQKISALEEQNEKAAEQRQKQIDLLQAQLDHTEKYGLQWEEAQTLIKNGFDSEGRLRVGTDLFDMLMSKEDFTSMGNGSTRQVQQIMDWNVMSIAAAAFREINDIWDEGFGNFAMSNDVHDQSRLHLWADREVDYYQLPSYLGFLQPALNTIQDYLWRTGNNIETFIDTGFLSGKNSSSILGKTVVPIVEWLFGEASGQVEDYYSLTDAEGIVKTHTGAIDTAASSLGYSFGEGILKEFTEGIRKFGANSTNSVSNNNENKKSVQFFGGITLQNYFNSEDGQDTSRFGENLVDAFREGISNLSIFK